MPELPEVETIRRDLQDLIVGCKVVGIWTDSPKQVQPSLELIDKAIRGATLLRIARRAKLLQLFLNNGKILVVHLKLTGRLMVRKKEAPRDEWQHVVIKLRHDKGENLELRFCDARKFGWIRLVKDQKELAKILQEFGPEPLDDLTLDQFKKILFSSNLPVKIVLMDQAKMAGVGNIYANEALFLAKIDPKRRAKTLTVKESEDLFHSLEKVLSLGLKYRGASDQYYLDALGRKGSYQDHFLVYQRQGQKCRVCGGLIKRVSLGGRGTFFCPRCQR